MSMSGGSKRVSGFTLVAPNLNHPEMIVVGAPPPPYSITWLPFLGATSHKLRTRVRRLSRNEYALPGASKKQSPPASGIGSEMSEVERRRCGLSRMSVFCGSLRNLGIALQPPGRSGFQPSMNHAHDLHGVKEIGNRVQFSPPIWTLEQVIRTN